MLVGEHQIPQCLCGTVLLYFLRACNADGSCLLGELCSLLAPQIVDGLLHKTIMKEYHCCRQWYNPDMILSKSCFELHG